MTWNLWWGFNDWKKRRQAILEVVREQQPDICGLQEVWADDNENMAEWLADHLGLHWVFGAPSDQERWRSRIGDPAARFGVAMLSRWPIRDEQVLDLPQDPSRPLLSAMIDAPHATIPFVTTHLSALPLGGSARRVTQVEAIARHVAALPVTDHPPIVTGDFNAEPDSDELRRFGGNLTAPVVEGQIFLDAWRVASPTDPGVTWDRANPYVGQWIEPSARIDYIHIAGRSAPLGHVRSAHRAGMSPVDGVWPSDHYAVVADISEGAQVRES
ncbi:endonuclease/exonuclease/phosphatase family protein [Rhizocola hellebori]|nr:endonuclease/exonuclease/phosphatase family protein [Rhizocola hellebori]